MSYRPMINRAHSEEGRASCTDVQTQAGGFGSGIGWTS